jgi:WhiB family redox-sensing transcriptional regulator
MDQEWRALAACKHQTKLFFPAEEKKTVKYSEALEICSSCPVVDECLDYAISYEMIHGIWGGKTPNQRRALMHDRMLYSA